jgi:hypothetical protein
MFLSMPEGLKAFSLYRERDQGSLENSPETVSPSRESRLGLFGRNLEAVSSYRRTDQGYFGRLS